ncbi:sulfotransferase family protein [Paenibacillus sp. strain BS8-2]
MSERPEAVIILGMHRSGTSLLAQTIRTLGVYLGEEQQLMSPREDNPEGFWEHEEIVAIHDELLDRLCSSWDTTKPLPENWWLTEVGFEGKARLIQIVSRDFSNVPLWGFKDPRTCLLLPLWQSVLKELNINARYILSIRNPLNVAASLKKRDQFHSDKSFGIWSLYVLSSLYYTSHEHRIVIDYDQLLDQPFETCRDICSFLNIPFSALEQTSIGNVPKKALRNNRFSIEDLNEDILVPALVKQTFLTVLSDQGDSRSARKKEFIEKIRNTYEQLVQMNRLLNHEKSHRVRIYWAGAKGDFTESTYITLHALERSRHTIEIHETLGSALRIDFLEKPAFIKIFKLSLQHDGQEINLIREYPIDYVRFQPCIYSGEELNCVAGVTLGIASQLFIRNLPPNVESSFLKLEISCSLSIENEVAQELWNQQHEVAALSASLRNVNHKIIEHENREFLIKREQVELLQQKDLEIDHYQKELACYRQEIDLYSKSLSWRVTQPLRKVRELERKTKRRLKNWALSLMKR